MLRSSNFGDVLTKKQEIQIEIPEDAFRKHLEHNVSKPAFFSQIFSIFKFNTTKYFGHVGEHAFRLTFAPAITNSRLLYVVIEGKFRQRNETLIIDVTIKGFNTLAKILLLELLLCMLVITYLIAYQEYDFSNFITFLGMCLIPILAITGTCLYEIRKGMQIALKEFIKDIYSIQEFVSKTK